MTDKLTTNLVVSFLGLTVISVIVGAVILAFSDHEIPSELWLLASGAVGALGGILARPNNADGTVITSSSPTTTTISSSEPIV